jgi:hypothetical protein
LDDKSFRSHCMPMCPSLWSDLFALPRTRHGRYETHLSLAINFSEIKL